jgi:hypothetical protein
MGGAASLQQDSSINSAAVLPQTCTELLEYVAGARAVYDVQIKVKQVLAVVVVAAVLVMAVSVVGRHVVYCRVLC